MSRIYLQESNHPVLKFLVVISWRFFTGAPLSGNAFKNDATWWQDATRGKKTWWQRKSRMKRLAWRNGIFWPTVLFTTCLIWQPSYTLWGLVMLAPYILYRAYFAFRFWFFVPFRANGQQQWRLNPKFRRVFRRKYRPGFHANILEDVPPVEVEKAIHAELELEAQDNGHPFNLLPILRMRLRR